MEYINILAILLSPIVALWISHFVQVKQEKKKEKIEILKILMARRILANSREYVNALNIIDIVFVDSPKVREAYRLLYEAYHQQNYDPSKSSMQLTKLIEAIVKDVGYKEKITWESIQQPYYPIWLDNEIKANSTIQEYNLAIATSVLNANYVQDCTNNQY